MEKIPEELRTYTQWVVWRLETREGKPTKIPYNPNTGKMASVSDPSSWSSWDKAIEIVSSPKNIKKSKDKRWGIGFVFTEQDPFFGIDCDDCVSDGSPHTAVNQLIADFRTYFEFSPSGTGIKFIGKGEKPSQDRSRTAASWGGEVEIYDRKRFFALTGKTIPHCEFPINNCQKELTSFYNNLFPKKEEVKREKKSTPTVYSNYEVMEKMFSSENGAKINALWHGEGEDESRRDLALMCHLAWWTNGNREQMESLFSLSKCADRDKWDNRPDYRERTIERALQYVRDGYQPGGPTESVLNFDNVEEDDGEDLGWDIKTGDDLLALEEGSTKIPWMVPGLLIEQGIHFVSAPGGGGKSWWIMELARCVSRGETFIGEFDVQQGNIAYIDEEMGEKAASIRVKKLNTEGSLSNFYYLGKQGIRLNSADDVKKIVKLIKRLNIKLLCVDTLTGCRPGLMENESSHVSALRAVFNSFTKAGATVLVAHHDRKTGVGEDEGAAHYHMAGSKDFGAMPDAVFSITHKPGNFNFKMTKNRHLSDEDAAQINFDFVIEDNEDKTKVTLRKIERMEKQEKTNLKIRQQIHDALIESGGLSTNDLANLIVGRRSTVIYLIKEMVEEGSVRMEKKGREVWYYAENLIDLPEKGGNE